MDEDQKQLNNKNASNADTGAGPSSAGKTSFAAKKSSAATISRFQKNPLMALFEEDEYRKLFDDQEFKAANNLQEISKPEFLEKFSFDFVNPEDSVIGTPRYWFEMHYLGRERVLKWLKYVKTMKYHAVDARHRLFADYLVRAVTLKEFGYQYDKIYNFNTIFM